MQPDDKMRDALDTIAANDARAGLASTGVLPIPRPEAPTFDIDDCYGVVGDYVRLWAPHTEAAPVAIYATALAALGALIGRGPSWRFGNEAHHARLFVLLIGVSGAGRKGTALNIGIGDLLHAVDDDFAKARRVSGLSSAEGLIAEVRDPTPPIIDEVTGKVKVAGDEGVSDKRLCVVEGEIAGALEAMSREGNRLSAIVRDAWDGRDLRSMVKRDPQRSTAPHVVIVGAITAPELRKLLKHTSVLNGLANRFLAVWSTRARLLPEDSAPDPGTLAAVHRRICAAVNDARAIGTVRWSQEAARMWDREYRERLAVVEDPSDTVRSLLERGAPYVRRVAFLLALLDGTGTVDVAHLRAALALWRYVADTWRAVYHDGSTRSALAEKILDALSVAGAEGLTRSAIRDDVVRSGDVAADRIEAALAELSGSGLALRVMEPTRGRPRERWQHARYVGAPLRRKGSEGSEGGDDCGFPPFPPFPPSPGMRACGPAFDNVPMDVYDRDAA